MFVAGFIGSPAMNVFPGRLENDGGAPVLATNSGRLPLPPALAARLRVDGSAAAGPREVMWGIRAEDVLLGPADAGAPSWRGAVDLVEGLGSDAYVSLSLNGDNLVARTPADARPKEGETVGVQVNANKLHLFDAKTEATLLQ
jgi:ABC-type sugar transport system ATPase subunit